VIIAACALVLLASAALAGWRAYRHGQWLAPALDMPRQVNAAGIALVRLNGGPLLIGSPISEAGRDGSERQARLEVPGPFWISTTEVTQRQYQAVMGRLPAGIAQAAPDVPVTNITWHEAMAFCAALGEREGRRYRLPTEAEWELACRAGSASAYAQPLERTGWWQSNSGRRLHAVGTLAPNRWGIQDMHGNAAEWCWSDRAAYYGSAPPDPAWKAVRGGSAVESDLACRSAARQFLRPGQRSAWVGFRIVYDPASTGAISDPPGFFVSAATQPH
jgi:formylglycine-generating enzyme required for sulfatase activity